jgi:4-aminobutyrate aminotransferase-like enzyme
LGIELVTDRATRNPANAETQKVYDYAMEKGLIFQIRGVRELKNVIRLVPPMTSTREEVDQALSILYDAFRGLKKRGSKRKKKSGK